LAWQLQLANQNTSQGNVLQRIGTNLSIVYRGLEEKTYQLTYCQKFPNLTTRAVRSNKCNRTGGYNYYPWDNSKCMAVLGVLCNSEYLDFNRAIYPTTLNKSVTVSRPQLHIFHRYVWCDMCNMNSTGWNCFFFSYAKTEWASFIMARQWIRSNLWLFLCWLAGFLVSNTPECWGQSYDNNFSTKI